MPQYKRSVAGIAIEDGRLFIAKRKDGGDLGGKWEFPGGKVENGESGEAALRREYLEEFGVQIETGPLLACAQFTHKGFQFELRAYRIFFKGLQFCMKEHSQWRWASLGEIERLDFAGSDRSLLPALKLYLEQDAGIHNR
ncbi:MAG: (deoxy)nucleoside triphosphate pyrophosphohydrolase [Treponema sp.]|jgi:8-oxo-dGTP diphosphatase|nr:(deoxy)nucleoside triphosphate pyrophosphohydrolase [Treponema sp.]